jgi:hypothetical protein
MDAVEFTAEPFLVRSNSFLYGADRSTRIMIFVLNLSLQPGETAAAVTADAEDAALRHYNLTVEYVGNTPGQEWLSAVVLKLDQDMGDAGDVLLQLTYQNRQSNRTRVGVGHVGGGPADDSGAGPTPAPPYTLSGQVILSGAGLSGVTIGLTGSATGSTTTGSDGMFSFVVTSAGDYTVTASRRFFSVSPATILLTSFANSQTVSLTAVRDLYAISGVAKDDQGNGLAGVSVKLESSLGGPSTQTITTNSNGTFSFPNLPAGFDYTITPTNTSVFAYTQQTVSALEQNSEITFDGTLRSYSISGLVSDRDQHAVSGATVVLSDGASATATTDSNGNYTFSNLLAGRTYAVTATKPDYYLNPSSQGFNLLKDERADFSATRFYLIKGKVTSNDGRGLMGILISLSGPETGSLRTPSDGSYSFTVTTPGNYVLTPYLEQNFYQFAPAFQNLPNLNDHQTVNFNGNIVINSPVYVLEFDGTPMSVDYGIFWPTNTNIGDFYWEFWGMPGPDNYARYMLSDGYGGAHALLFGFDYSEETDTHWSILGNVWDGEKTVYFKSDEGPASNEWGHYAVGWDGQYMITYYDGVPVGKREFTGPRVSTGTYNGSTMLLIGGSNHQNIKGRIAQVRGYEENNPRGASPESTFVPATVFPADGQLLSYYFKPSGYVADLSHGYRGSQHFGWPRGMLDFYFNGCPGCPTPQFVIDPTAPDFSNPSNPGHVTTFIESPAAPPAGNRIFDSFSRDNSTYILNGKGGIGSTETGSRTWQSNVNPAQPQPFGILNGHVVPLADSMALAWVTPAAGSGNLDVRVNRTFGKWGTGRNTGLCFRVIDKDNFFFAYTANNPADLAGPKLVTVGYVQAGIPTILASGLAIPTDSANPPDIWRTLRVVTLESGAITIYASSKLVYSTSNSFAATATGAGLFNCCAAMGIENRWDYFAVFDAP